MSEKQATAWFANPPDLAEIECDCWSYLTAAVTDRESGWRLPILATNEMGQSRQRVLVLRSVDSVKKQLFFHTDARSAKVATLQANPQVSWLFYDHRQQVQLQVTGPTEVQTSLESTAWLWDSESPASLKGYLATLLPGSRCAEPETNVPAEWLGSIPDRAELSAGRKNFAVICTTVTAMEWLILRRDGNLRAFFAYDGAELSENGWLAP